MAAHALFRSRHRLFASSVAAMAVAVTMAGGCRSGLDRVAADIRADEQLPAVLHDATALVKAGLTAGGQYPQVWIRDLNTFIDLAIDKDTQPEIRRSLIGFLHFQSDANGIPDGYGPIDPQDPQSDWTSPALPGFAAFKNTVETDQESSLVQAVARYVARTGDRTLLDEVVDGVPVRARLARALQFPLTHRFSDTYGLLWGATTIDWGDVQPETRAGVYFSAANSHPAIDIYDNAMFLLAVDAYVDLVGATDADAARLKPIADRIRQQVRTVLWDDARHKFRPHVYLDGSPFPSSFDEDRIYYHGGTAVAIEASLLQPDEVLRALHDMLDDQQRAGAASIGLSVYPAYPDGLFRHPIIHEYAYQNGGDWTWFGARMVRQLVRYGYAADAYAAVQPMVARAARDHGFYEWYTLKNQPRGSGAYRGAAGQLGLAIQSLLDWAKTRK
ncbi:MAG TPA: hypothetical protein VHB78_17735 [Vicinamibacterales bacterium]|jgi:hypothetical protein|nr:hypothetical protein [Vicinamibacterales bacterium]